METAVLSQTLQNAKPYGFVGLVLMLIIILWYMDSRKVYSILNQYKSDMAEMRRMYESNVDLVKDYKDLAADLKEVVIMNTQAITRMDSDVKGNQFCPMVRLDKKAKGVTI